MALTVLGLLEAGVPNTVELCSPAASDRRAADVMTSVIASFLPISFI